MKMNWDKWYQEAIDMMDCQYNRIDLTRSDKFERDAWRAWNAEYEPIDFASQFIRELVQEL
jgi:hypothetical protein